MPKKMYDVVPPGVSNKPEDLVKAAKVVAKKPRKPRVAKTEPEVLAVVAKPLKTPPPVMPPKPKELEELKERRFPLKEVLIGGVVVVLLFIVWGLLKLPKADIQIWPKTETLTLSQKVTADVSVKAVDVTKNLIPAKYMEETKESWQEFLATGSASNDGKASGTIKIYNKTDSAFGLVKGTHFLSDSGKYFVTLEKVTIPAAKKSNPGSIDVKVQAEESGDEYNIKPAKFSAPKLYGTSYYYSIYGESSDAMTGGKTGTVKKVTDDDIKQAKDSLTKKLLDDVKNSLKSQLAADEVMLDSSIQNIVVDASPDVKVGTIVDKFNESAKVKVGALVYKKKDLEQIVKTQIDNQIEDYQSIVEGSLSVAPTAMTADMKLGKMSLNTNSSVKTFTDMDTNELVDLFSRKSSEQIKGVVDQMYTGAVTELKVSFWPFWVHKAPSNKDRIKVNLLFE